MNKSIAYVLLWLMFCGGLLTGFGLGAHAASKDMRNEIARRGFGAYKADSITGKVVFEWKESAK